MLKTYKDLNALNLNDVVYRVDDGDIVSAIVCGINHDMFRDKKRIYINFSSGSAQCTDGSEVDWRDKFFLNINDAKIHALTSEMHKTENKISELLDEISENKSKLNLIKSEIKELG